MSFFLSLLCSSGYFQQDNEETYNDGIILLPHKSKGFMLYLHDVPNKVGNKWNDNKVSLYETADWKL